MSKFPSTVIAYEGQSMLTSEPIVMLLTGLENPSSNMKTGAMVQAVILDGSLKPTEAIKSGSDANVCGNRGERTRHISIEVHGLDWKVKNFSSLTTV